MTKRVALAAVTIAAALLLLTAFSLQSALYSQIIQQQSSYAQEPAASPITAEDGNNAASSSSSTTTTDNNAVDNNLTKTDGILTATINGANFTRNQMIEVKGKVDDEVITPESGVWIAVKDPTNETTHAKFVPLNAADKSFSYGIVAGYYDEKSRGFYKPMGVSGKNCTMTVVYNTDGPSSSTTTSSGNNKSSLEVQFIFAYDHSITTEPQPQPQQTDGILTATINGANFVRNQTISVEGKVDDEVITPKSGVWITVKDPTNETTHIDFVPVNMSDRSFSYSILAGYYDGNSYGFYKPMGVSGKNCTMTVVYNTDNGPSTTSSSTTTSSGNNKSSLEVQFIFAYDHSITTPVSAAVIPDTEPDLVASQFAGNQSTTTTTTITPTAKTKTNGLLTATINSSHFTTNQTIKVNGIVREAAGPFITVYVKLKDPQDETLLYEFAPIVRSNKSGSDNETSFSYRLVAGDVDDGSQDDAASDSGGGHNRGFWKPMNETGNNYTMILGYATPAPPSSSSSSSSGSGSAEENSRSEVQFVFAYEHLLPPE